jgi:hypothetical protein
VANLRSHPTVDRHRIIPVPQTTVSDLGWRSLRTAVSICSTGDCPAMAAMKHIRVLLALLLLGGSLEPGLPRSLADPSPGTCAGNQEGCSGGASQAPVDGTPTKGPVPAAEECGSCYGAKDEAKEGCCDTCTEVCPHKRCPTGSGRILSSAESR